MLVASAEVEMKSNAFTLVAVASVLSAHAAVADEYSEYTDEMPHPAPYDYSWSEPSMQSKIGLAMALGGGISGFTDPLMRDSAESDIGGMWGVRVTIGSHIPVGVDLAYNGTSVDLDPVGTTQTGTLVGTEFETAVRWNVLPHYAWNPYAFVGVGWQRYDVMNGDFTRADSGFVDQDDLLVMPMGGGLAWRDNSGFVVDVKGTFRLAETSTLLIDSTGERADLHTWEASATVGYEL